MNCPHCGKQIAVTAAERLALDCAERKAARQSAPSRVLHRRNGKLFERASPGAPLDQLKPMSRAQRLKFTPRRQQAAVTKIVT